MTEISKDLQELLLDDQTKKEFGYSTFDLTKGSSRLIYHKCIICNCLKRTIFRYFIKHECLTHNGKCKQKLGEQTNLERYGVKFSLANKEVRKKIEQTNLERYGVKSTLSLESVKQKQKATNLLRYGVENPLKSFDIRKKIEQTNLERYGVKSTLLLKDVRQKQKETNLERYGVECPLSFIKVRQKIEQTNLKKYGTKSVLQCDKIRQKIYQTNFKKYGTKYSSNSNIVKQKIKETFFKKYGVKNPSQLEYIKAKVKKTKIEKFGTVGIPQLHQNFSKEYWLQQSWNGCRINLNQKLPDKWSQGTKQKFEIVCSCNKIWRPQFSDFTSGRVKSCGHNSGTSFAEQEVLSFIQNDLGINCQHRYKIKDVEFDIYILDQQICIEYNGLIWHGQNKFNPNKFKDYNKYLFCKENNFRYVGIYEDEWLYHQDRVKNYLKTILGHKDQIKIRPQELTVKYSNHQTQEIRDFLSKYHYLPNYTSLKHIWTCYYNNILIAVLGIGSPTRQTIKEPFELKRVCLHPDYKCYGLWSFLFKHYVKQLSPITITSFSDNRRDTGNLYKLLNFEDVRQLQPDYYWCKGNQRFHKSNFKKTAEERLTGKTETELREAEGFFKVWDCGKTKWNLSL